MSSASRKTIEEHAGHDRAEAIIAKTVGMKIR
jgi:hypothetical protein